MNAIEIAGIIICMVLACVNSIIFIICVVNAGLKILEIEKEIKKTKPGIIETLKAFLP